MASSVGSNNPKSSMDGRCILVDPNPADGNLVPLEDLSIYVQLSVQKKNRSIINQTNSGGVTITNNNSAAQSMNISFINGSPNGTKGNTSLTTNYTDITPLGSSSGKNKEGLGITNIDIEFNTGFAPLITISMIDVRGSTIFASGNKSYYNVFFTLPYPIFSLMIKGYYGKTVNYCLHLLKFTSKFNSKTGNFEIVLKFIGYTYAFLTDMLMGYLQGITGTRVGINKLKGKYFPNTTIQIPSLNEYVNQMKGFDATLGKLKRDDPNFINYQICSEALTLLAEIQSFPDDNMDTISSTASNTIFFGDKSTNIYCFGLINNTDIQHNTYVAIKNYNDNIDAIIATYNTTVSNSNYNLNSKDFEISLQPNAYVTISIQSIQSNGLNISKTNAKSLSNITDSGLYTNILNQAIKANIGITTPIMFIDLRQAFDNVTKMITKVNNDLNSAQNQISEELNVILQKAMTFTPTIRNIFTILTAHAEILVECIQEVAKASEDLSNTKRNNALLKYLNQLDVPNNTKKTVYAFPEYDVEGTEDWIGNNKQLNDIDEVTFIKNLVAGMNKAANINHEYSTGANNGSNNSDTWPSVNPFDNVMYNNTNPYAQDGFSQMSTTPEMLSYIILRAFIFMGITNKNLTKNEIMVMAALEANSLFNNITDDNKDKINTFIASVNANASTFISYLTNIASNINLITHNPVLFADSANLQYKFIAATTVQSADNNSLYIPIATQATNAIATEYLEGTRFFLLPANSMRPAPDLYNDLWSTPMSTEIQNNTAPLHPTYAYVGNYGFYDLFGGSVTITTDYTKASTGQILHRPNDGAMYIDIINYSDYTSYQQGSEYNLNTIEKLAGYNSNTYIESSNLNKNYNANTPNTINWSPFAGHLFSQEFLNIDMPYDTTYTNKEGLAANLIFYDTTYRGCYNSYFMPTNSTPSNQIIPNTDLINLDRGYQQYKYIPNPNNSKNLFLAYNYYNGNNYIGNKNDIIGNIGYSWSCSVNHNHMDGSDMVQRDINSSTSYDKYVYSVPRTNIFASKLYWAQQYIEGTSTIKDLNTTYLAQAYLFLHCLPFNGIYSPKSTISEIAYEYDASNNNVSTDDICGILSTDEVRGLFSERAGFVLTPYPWILFIGSLLWRYREGAAGSDPITFSVLIPSLGSNPIPMVPYNPASSFIKPKYSEYIKALVPNPNYSNHAGYANSPMSFTRDNTQSYAKIERVIFNLPDQVKNAFINKFKDWAIKDSDIGFKHIQYLCEVFNFKNINLTNFLNVWGTSGAWGNISSNSSTPDYTNPLWNSYNINTNLNSPVPTLTYYNNITQDYNINGIIPFYTATGYPTMDIMTQDFACVLNQTSSAYVILTNFIKEQRIIVNSTWRIWNSDSTNSSIQAFTMGDATNSNFPITVSNTNMNSYLDSFIKAYTTLYNSYKTKKIAKKTDSNDTVSDPKLLLNVYRGIKAINDKWIAGGAYGINSIISLCGTPSRNIGQNTPLINIFKFIDKAYNDIGDKLIINPLTISNMLTENNNQSLYDVISRVLSDSNVDFIPLPAYIDYQDVDTLSSAFQPYPYIKMDSSTITDPSFICMYIGQRSTKLDLGDSQYLNDGVDFNGPTFKRDGNKTGPFSENLTTPNGIPASRVPVIAVNYGQENQSMFSDIKLDQEEFTETDESLKIIDAISSGENKGKGTFTNQGLFNVWSVRSYSCTVESLGNVMIQPMMYFQLNNIPMFHGGYLIIKVNHSIVPNHMTTNFTGVRVKKNMTPLMDMATVFSLLNGSLTSADIKNKGITTTGGILPNADSGTIGVNFGVDDKNVLINSADFIAKVQQVAAALNIPEPKKNYVWLMACMQQESHLKSNITNSAGAVGLIQFFPGNAGLGQLTNYLNKTSVNPTTENKYNIVGGNLTQSQVSTFLQTMNAIEQMDYVQWYFQQNITLLYPNDPIDSEFALHLTGWGAGLYPYRHNLEKVAYSKNASADKALSPYPVSNADWSANDWDRFAYNDNTQMRICDLMSQEEHSLNSIYKPDYAYKLILPFDSAFTLPANNQTTPTSSGPVSTTNNKNPGGFPL